MHSLLKVRLFDFFKTSISLNRSSWELFKNICSKKSWIHIFLIPHLKGLKKNKVLENFLAKTIFFIRPKEFFFHGHEDQKCQGVERWWSWNSLMCILPAYFTNFDIGCCLHTIFWRIHVKIHLNVLTFHFNFILPGVWKYSPIFPQPNSYPNMYCEN